MKIYAFLRTNRKVLSIALFMGACATFLVFILDDSMELFRYIFIFCYVTLVFVLMGRRPAPPSKALDRDKT